jgi:hypothetical protein
MCSSTAAADVQQGAVSHPCLAVLNLPDATASGLLCCLLTNWTYRQCTAAQQPDALHAVTVSHTSRQVTQYLAARPDVHLQQQVHPGHLQQQVHLGLVIHKALPGCIVWQTITF